MKRAFDICLGAVGLVIASPVIACAAVAVKLSSPGPAFYRGPRVGRGGRTFRIYKIRTMQVGSDQSGPAVTTASDSRVTSMGRALRRAKIDELPQLLNVLQGDMSLIGPRPEHPSFVARYTPEQRAGLAVRPGITGPGSLAFLEEEQMLEGGDPEATYVNSLMPRKLAMDLDYVAHSNLWLDVRILAKTGFILIRRAFRRPHPSSGA